MPPAKPTKILIIRNDKLGDFCLSLPSFALLKQCIPSTNLHALVPEYTRPIAEACPYIDRVIIDPGTTASRKERKAFYDALRQETYTAALTLYSTSRIGLLLSRLRVPIRVAPATKIAQLFHNHRLRQKRSESRKPEYEYNLDLGRYLIKLMGINCDFIPEPPYIHFKQDEIKQLKNTFCEQYSVNKDKLLLFIHPGSGGSANNLSPHQYAKLASNLAKDRSYHIVLTAGPGEYEMARRISAEINQSNQCVYESRRGLVVFAKHIAFADIFISGSTGPLHLAGSLNRPTVGFYTNRRSATSLRWQTLSTNDRRLAFSPPPGASPEDMISIDLDEGVLEIQKMLTRLYL